MLPTYFPPGQVSRTLARLARSYAEYHGDAQYKIGAAAWVGVATFPLFYIVWTFIFPQPYESWIARSIGSGLCLALAICPRVRWIRRAVLPLSYVTFVYCLPFFFTYMLLKNGGSHEWQLSFLAAFV